MSVNLVPSVGHLPMLFNHATHQPQCQLSPTVSYFPHLPRNRCAALLHLFGSNLNCDTSHNAFYRKITALPCRSTLPRWSGRPRKAITWHGIDADTPDTDKNMQPLKATLAWLSTTSRVNAFSPASVTGDRQFQTTWPFQCQAASFCFVSERSDNRSALGFVYGYHSVLGNWDQVGVILHFIRVLLFSLVNNHYSIMKE